MISGYRVYDSELRKDSGFIKTTVKTNKLNKTL